MQKNSKQLKKSYFDTLGTKKITDKRPIWKTTLPHFTQKVSKGEKMNLIEKVNVMSSDEEICSIFNDFFANTVSTLIIPTIEHSHSTLQNINIDSILATVDSYDKYPSIEKIKNRSCSSTFSFRKTNSNEVSKIIDNLNI